MCNQSYVLIRFLGELRVTLAEYGEFEFIRAIRMLMTEIVSVMCSVRSHGLAKCSFNDAFRRKSLRARCRRIRHQWSSYWIRLFNAIIGSSPNSDYLQGYE